MRVHILHVLTKFVDDWIEITTRTVVLMIFVFDYDLWPIVKNRTPTCRPYPHRVTLKNNHQTLKHHDIASKWKFWKCVYGQTHTQTDRRKRTDRVIESCRKVLMNTSMFISSESRSMFIIRYNMYNAQFLDQIRNESKRSRKNTLTGNQKTSVSDRPHQSTRSNT